MLTTTQAARLFQVTAQTIINWMEQGRLPFARIGRGPRRIDEGRLVDFIVESGYPLDSLDPTLWRRLQERRTREVAAQAPPSALPFFLSDAQGRFLHWSRAMEETLGRPASTLEGQVLGTLPARVPGMAVDLAALVEDDWGGERLDLRLEFAHADGRYLPAEVTLSRLHAPVVPRQGLAGMRGRDANAPGFDAGLAGTAFFCRFLAPTEALAASLHARRGRGAGSRSRTTDSGADRLPH